MKRVICLAIVLLTYIQLSSQNVIDGVFIKDKILDSKKGIELSLDGDGGLLGFYSSTNVDTLLRLVADYKQKENKPFESMPFKDDDCVYFNPLNDIHYTEYSKKLLPTSIIYDLNAGSFDLDTLHQSFLINDNFNLDTDKYTTPFYFKKTEVSNKEYREFVNWVRDSIAHKYIGEEHIINPGEPGERIDWSVKIDWLDEEIQEFLWSMYLPEAKRFLRKEIDSRILFYDYQDENGFRNKLNIFPDTLSWVNDFTHSFNEPLAQQYFWHPAYDNYPVVGLSFYQVKAFMHWKTAQLQKELKAKGVECTIRVDLPTEAQWEMVSTGFKEKKAKVIYGQNYRYLVDDSWITDLKFTPDRISKTIKCDGTVNCDDELQWGYDKTLLNKVFTEKRLKGESSLNEVVYTRINAFDKFLNHKSQYFSGSTRSYNVDGGLHTLPVDYDCECKKMPNYFPRKDEFGIYNLGGNVSEWIDESYQKSYKPLFDSLQVLRQNSGQKDLQLLSEIEKYYDARNDSTGMLVRGSNWFDERYAYKLGKNIAGTNAKVFLDPNKSHCTVGFRYVINVYPKEE